MEHIICHNDMLFFYAYSRRTKEPTYWYAVGLADNPQRRTEEPTPPKHRRRIIERLLYFGGGKYMVVAISIGDFSRKI
ncbi:MAG: hypothetical protein J6Y52_00435 [Bacteroidales bacterium]|nr:hypothetical protein [Bacteroidales bacterium]